VRGDLLSGRVPLENPYQGFVPQWLTQLWIGSPGKHGSGPAIHRGGNVCDARVIGQDPFSGKQQGQDLTKGPADEQGRAAKPTG
jgi:hypothetical protein